MRLFVCVVVLATSAIAVPRQKRQNGDFWWLKNNEDPTAPAPSNSDPGQDSERHLAETFNPVNGGLPQGGLPQGGFPPDGFPQGGFPHDGLSDQGFPQDGFPQDGFPQDGFPQAGFPQGVFPEGGLGLGGNPGHINNDPSFRPCECVPYYQCEDGDIITDGAGLIGLRIGPVRNSTAPRSGLVNDQCESFLKICCNIPNTDLVPIDPPVKYVPTCGRRNYNGVHVRLTGAGHSPTSAQYGEFPWMAAILRVEQVGDTSVNLYLCGGSLIKPNVVLTAAHCINTIKHNKHNLIVRLGEWDTQNVTEPFPHQNIGVQDVIINSQFNDKSLHNDFALLILKTSAVLSATVDTVCLPEAYSVFSGETCYVTGWGKDKFGANGTFQNVLKKIDLPVVDHTYCENSLRHTRLGDYFRLDQSFMCAGGQPGKDTCKGDGGSPLVCISPKNHINDPDVYVQTGIVAWGIGCGEQGVPGVYADVTKAVNWIDSSLAGYNIN